MYFAPLLFSMIVAFNGLSFLNGAKLQIESRSARDWIVVQEGKTLEESITHCRSMDREMVSILTEEDADHFADITKDIDTSKSEHGYIRIGLQVLNKDCQWTWIGSDQAFNPGNWFWQGNEPNGCRRNELCAQTGRGSKKWNDSKCYYKTFFVCGNKAPTPTTTTEAPTTPAAEKTGDCEDKNVLCQTEPSFILDILCQIDTVKEQCPKRCNSCPEPVETTEAITTTTTAMPKCERKYNGYYSYGDCGSQNGVKSFEECCELTKQRNATSSRNIIRFSWNGNSCAFKCGGKQDNRGGNWWSSAEDISTCTCQ